MYINDINIFYYIIVIILGIFAGQLVDWSNIRMPDYKKVFTREFFTEHKKNTKSNYIWMIVTVVLYLLALYQSKIDTSYIYIIILIKNLLLIPMVLIAFIVDYRLQIIPNRLNLTLFEVGLVFTFLLGSFSMSFALRCLLGMLVGGGIFLFLTLVGGLIAGKEAMGMGDVKLMGALGLFFGWTNIIVITLIAFLLSAIVSIPLLISKKKGTNEYIPFGPFIVVGTLISLYVPSDYLMAILWKIFTLGMS